MRTVVVQRDNDGTWVAEVPSLPGTMHPGQSKMNALQNIHQDIHAWIEAAQAEDQENPDEEFEVRIPYC